MHPRKACRAVHCTNKILSVSFAFECSCSCTRSRERGFSALPMKHLFLISSSADLRKCLLQTFSSSSPADQTPEIWKTDIVRYLCLRCGRGCSKEHMKHIRPSVGETFEYIDLVSNLQELISKSISLWRVSVSQPNWGASDNSQLSTCWSATWASWGRLCCASLESMKVSGFWGGTMMSEEWCSRSPPCLWCSMRVMTKIRYAATKLGWTLICQSWLGDVAIQLAIGCCAYLCRPAREIEYNVIELKKEEDSVHETGTGRKVQH